MQCKYIKLFHIKMIMGNSSLSREIVLAATVMLCVVAEQNQRTDYNFVTFYYYFTVFHFNGIALLRTFKTII